MKGNFAAIVLVVLGTFFLLNNLGLVNISLAELFKTWWPAILIAVGLAMFALPNDSKKD
jgi:cytochrome c biogenesis protein CcdA